MVALRSHFLLLVGLCVVASSSFAMYIPPLAEAVAHVEPGFKAPGVLAVKAPDAPVKSSVSTLKAPSPFPKVSRRALGPANIPIKGAPQPPKLLLKLPVSQRDLPVKGAPQLQKPPIAKRFSSSTAVVDASPSKVVVHGPHKPVGKRSYANAADLPPQITEHSPVKYTRSDNPVIDMLTAVGPKDLVDDTNMEEPADSSEQLGHTYTRPGQDVGDAVLNDPSDSAQLMHANHQPMINDAVLDNPGGDSQQLAHANDQPKMKDIVVDNSNSPSEQLAHANDQSTTKDIVVDNPNRPSEQLTHANEQPKDDDVNVNNPASGGPILHKNVQAKRNHGSSPDYQHQHHHHHHGHTVHDSQRLRDNDRDHNHDQGRDRNY